MKFVYYRNMYIILILHINIRVKYLINKLRKKFWSVFTILYSVGFVYTYYVVTSMPLALLGIA